MSAGAVAALASILSMPPVSQIAKIPPGSSAKV
jgi:hypothetical protein